MGLLQKHSLYHKCYHISLGKRIFSVFHHCVHSIHKPTSYFARCSVSQFQNSQRNLHDHHVLSKPIIQTTISSRPTCHRKFSTSRTFSSSPSTFLFFPEFPTIKAAENSIQFIHGLTGLPWWSSIIVTAFLVRLVLPMPLTAYSMHNSVRLKKIEPEIEDIALRLKGEVSMAVREFGWDQAKAKQEYIKNMKRHIKILYIRDNCHPMKDTATFWIHIPVWLSVSYALRNMASRGLDPHLENHVDCESWSREGIAWFEDLTQTDTTWILPVMLGTITLCNFELHRTRVSNITTYHKVLTVVLRCVALVFIPISASMPSGLVLYWVSSGIFATAQNRFIVHSKWFKRLIRLPLLPHKEKT